MTDLMGKVALVTGAGSGIGRAAALSLGRAGAKTVVTSRTAAEVKQTAASIVAMGGQALALTADISDAAATAALVARAIDRYGQLDIVVANAGRLGADRKP